MRYYPKHYLVGLTSTRGAPGEVLELQVVTSCGKKYFLPGLLIDSNTNGFADLTNPYPQSELRAEASRSQWRLDEHAGWLYCRFQTHI